MAGSVSLLTGISNMNLFQPVFVALNRRIIPSLSSCIRCDALTDVILAAHVPSGAACS